MVLRQRAVLVHPFTLKIEGAMSTLIKIAGGLALLLGLIALIGLAPPKNFRIERSVVIDAPFEKIYPLIAEPENRPKRGVWNQRDPNMQMEFSGAASAVGANGSWRSKTEGNGAIKFTAAEPNKQIAY